jgi:predicted nicotinamide N-methyase
VLEDMDDDAYVIHIVDGFSCREVHIDLPVVGTVTVLEATAQAQEDLVDMALALDESEVHGEQKLSAGDPYGAVLWPAAWAVAKYLLTTGTLGSRNMEDAPLKGVSIVELGTGTGLVSIAAALGGAQVLATDYEPLALALTQYSAQTFHGKTLHIETQLLDMCDYDTPLPKADIVVAADIMYEPKTGIAMAYRAVEGLKQGSRVIVGDSPGRPGRPAFLETLRSLGVSKEARFVETIGRTCSGPRHEMICGKGSTSVSQSPKDLIVALMDLDPSMLT